MTPFQRLFSVLTNPWVATAYWGLIVVSFFYFDVAIASYFYKLDLRQTMPVLNWLTNLGIGGVYLAFFLGLAFFFRYLHRNKRFENTAWFVWLCLVITGAICLFLKVIFGRARPGLYFSDDLYGFYWLQKHASFWSFPSGHTTNIMGLTFALSIILPKYCYYFITAGLIVAFSRVLLTHHYLSDVLAAVYLAMLEIGIFYIWLQRKNWLIARTI